MIYTEWREHERLGVVSYDVEKKNGIDVVEVQAELWRDILDQIGFKAIDGPPSV